MQFDEEASLELMRRELVDGEAAALSNRTNLFKEIFIAAGAWLDVNDHVGIGHDLPDALLNGVAGDVSLLETRSAGDADRYVDEIALAGAANADAFAAENSFGAGDGGRNSLLQTDGRDIEQ